ncbi:MAG: trimeric intracellular cation channel family protein [Duodenibacillus sp.]|nr:trimeric intracellular cation channel family protein [Duodenibacillus sp.]
MIVIDPLILADFLGIVAFAFAGILAAEGKKVDPVGVFVLAFTTAFGGGLVRDVIIDNRPFYWMAHEEYVWMTLVLSLFAPQIIRRLRDDFAYAVFIWSDAIGLGFFAVGGTALSLQSGMPMLASTMLGVCTGVFGGLVRDVFLNRMPMVLSDGQPYASAAFIGCWLYIGMLWVDIESSLALWIATVFIVAVRMFTWYRGMSINIGFLKLPGKDDGKGGGADAK